jgi:endo-1,4-beta-D-glucanase Y
MSAWLHPKAGRRRASPSSRATAWVVFALAAAALAPAMLLGFSGGSSADGLAPLQARAFLARYVAPDGRVVRWDQGGDTVSEGQAYAMLLAQSIGDGALYAHVWRWTAAHLQRPDGLFAYLAGASGRVRDAMPAADADLLIAWSLARTSGPRAGAYHRAARRIAAAILRRETARRGGMLILAAGPWATGAPVSIDPSYWALPAFRALAALTGDQRWLQLARASLKLTISLTADGVRLPPDWARVDGEKATPSPAPSGAVAQVQYGLDAQRLVVWMGASCNAADRRLAARWASKLTGAGSARALALSPDGSVIDSATNALPLVAAAAAAQAAGQQSRRDELLTQAAGIEDANPTYYGAAWLALGRTLLMTPSLGRCAAAGGEG